MHNLECYELIVRGCTAGNEEKRRIAAIDNLGVCMKDEDVSFVLKKFSIVGWALLVRVCGE
jgi:hypothetical protein